MTRAQQDLAQTEKDAVADIEPARPAGSLEGPQ